MMCRVIFISFFLASCHVAEEKTTFKPSVKLKTVNDLIPELQTLKQSPVTIVFKSYGCFHHYERSMTISYKDDEYLVKLDDSRQGGAVRQYFVDTSFINDLYRFGENYQAAIKNTKNTPEGMFSSSTTVSFLEIQNGLILTRQFIDRNCSSLFGGLTMAVKGKSCDENDRKLTLFYFNPEGR